MFNIFNIKNKSFSILPISSFEKNGPFAWPGTLKECSDILEFAHFCSSKDQLLRTLDFSPNVLQKIKGWSFLEFSCSLFFFYYQNLLNKGKQNDAFVLDSEIWIIASKYILNTNLSFGFTQFIKELGIVALSKNDSIITGLIYSLTYTRFKKQSLCSKASLENLLYFVDIGDKEKKKLIETVFAQQNAKKIIEFLLDLKKNNRPAKNLTNFLQRLSLTTGQLIEVTQELSVLLEDRSLINLSELENFEIIDILSSSDGFVEKIVNLEISTYYHTILFDIIKNKECFSLEIFQLFENYFSTRFKNATTLEDKQELLRTIEPIDLSKLITEFYQTEKNILTEKIQKNFYLLQIELKNITPKQIVKTIVFTSALLLVIMARRKYVPARNERYLGPPPYGSISHSYATRYAKQALADPSSAATSQSPTFPAKSTKTAVNSRAVKMQSPQIDQTLTSGKNKQTLSSTAKATKRAKLGTGTKTQKKAASITAQTTTASTKSEEVKVIDQKVQAQLG